MQAVFRPHQLHEGAQVEPPSDHGGALEQREVSAGELFVVYSTSDAKTAQDYSKATFNTMGRSVRVTRSTNAN